MEDANNEESTPVSFILSDGDDGVVTEPEDPGLETRMCSRDENDGVRELSAFSRSTSRGDREYRQPGFRKVFLQRVALSVLFLGVICCAILALRARIVTAEKNKFRENAEYVAGSDPAFVNYVSTPAAAEIPPHPALCDRDIVKMTCQVLNNETLEFYGNRADNDNKYVHAAEISEVLSVNRAAVLHMFESLRLSNWDTYNKNAFAVSCQELCEKLVGSFQPMEIPSMSDVGCYWHGVGLAPVCDVDLAPHLLSAIFFTDRPPNKTDDHYLEIPMMEDVNPDGHDTDKFDSALNARANPTTAEQLLLQQLDYPNISYIELRTSVLHLFRIFPVVAAKAIHRAGVTEVFEGVHPEPLLSKARKLKAARAEKPEKKPLGEVNYRLLGSNTPSDDSCDYANDGMCDEASGSCAKGTDCTDCRDCSTPSMRNGQTDDSCQYNRDGACDEPPQSPYYCYSGTDCTDCGTCGHATPAPTPAAGGIQNWRQKTLQLAVKAGAMCSQALTKLASRQIPHIVSKWYGNNLDTPTRQEVKRLLRAVKDMLGKVDYIYPGDQCSPNTYAYVYPNAPWNKDQQGKFLYYLCDYYMKVSADEQIETLLHEGSHHHLANTDDSKWSGTAMYGQLLCSQVADSCRQGSQGACTLARKNADTFCYFTNDAAKAPTGIQPDGRRRRTSYTPRRRRAYPVATGGTEVPASCGFFCSIGQLFR